MRVDENRSGILQDALSKGLLKRIPLTFLPFVNQQLDRWETLYPNERQSVERLLLYVASLTPEHSADLFRTVVEIEAKMGVRHWQFSTKEQTIQNSSLLAASPYFQDWRRAVQAVFDAADQHALDAQVGKSQEKNRLVLVDIPNGLPLDSTIVWRRWQGLGRTMQLDLTQQGASRDAFDLLINGDRESIGPRSMGLLEIVQRRSTSANADAWVIDAGMGLVDSVLASRQPPSPNPSPVILGFSRLDTYRESFSHEMNTMRKDLSDADAIFDHLRKVDVSGWCPAEVGADPATREFVRSLYLSGNGAVIFGNSFVQWAASEAFRRARPSFLAAQFGVRTKPKPFTGVAVFDDPDKVNPLPAVPDYAGSALDAQMLALYLWLAAYRYAEYQDSTACLCVAQSISEAYIVAPAEFPRRDPSKPVGIDWLGDALRDWIA